MKRIVHISLGASRDDYDFTTSFLGHEFHIQRFGTDGRIEKAAELMLKLNKKVDAIALGGRYDNAGRRFGRARPATGFSMDLRQLHGLLPAAAVQQGILAPYRDDAALQAVIADLRARGETVVVDLLGQPEHRAELNCDRQLVLRDGQWRVVEMNHEQSETRNV
ncbi:MAG: ATP phosphoribosyltransferase regulatory subunit [candidate division WOR-3 bacterium]